MLIGMGIMIVMMYGAITIDFARLKTIANFSNDYNVSEETGRLRIWKKGIDMMLRHPLTGVGISCFSEAIGQERRRDGVQEIWQTAHNSLVQIGAENGLLGLMLFLLISYRAVKIFRRAEKVKEPDNMAKTAAMAKIAFIGYFVAAMFLSQGYSIIWVFLIALSARMNEFIREDREAKRGVEGGLVNKNQENKSSRLIVGQM